MKNTIKILLIIASALPVPCSIFPLPCLSETYMLIGERHLRKYTAPSPSQVYNSETDVREIVNNLCYVDWVRSFERDSTSTSHTESQLNDNVANRDKFDAALFCAYHTNGTHVAYANAAVYRYRLPDGQLPRLTSLSAYVSSDPYNSLGARIVLMTNATGEIPTDCATCRGDVVGGIKAAGVAQRITRTVSGKNYWYPSSSNLVFSSSNGLSTGLQLQKYLFVFVLMENYATSRGNWIEGCSYLANSVRITTSSAVPGWSDGSTVDLSFMNVSECEEDHDDLMAYYETTRTVVVCTNRLGKSVSFLAPESSYLRIHRLDTNPPDIDRSAFRYGDSWAMGTNVFLNASSGMTVMSVLPKQKVLVLHDRVRAERGFEPEPPTKAFTDTDRDLINSYLDAVGHRAMTLEHGKADFDGDGVPDGWEIYVGTDPTNAADAALDPDGDGLNLVQEFDHGHFPTNPWLKDTDMDGIIDRFALKYHLKGDEAGKDFDRDGLSNYAEYLITEVFRICTLDPDVPASNGFCIDYFRKVGDLYLGYVFTDHDLVGDVFESLYPSCANQYVFDSLRDDDMDGWPNIDEYFAGTNPSTSECPSPVVSMTVRYNDITSFSPPIVVKAWNEEKDPGANYIPDAIWTLTNDFYRSRGTVVLPEPDRTNKSLGHLRKGKTTFIVYAAESDGSYSPGKPLGVVREVDVGFSSASFDVTLSNVSPVSTRLSLWKGYDDRTVGEIVSIVYGDNGVTVVTNRPTSAKASETCVVRVVNPTNGFVVLEKPFNRSCRDFICEADFMPVNVGTNAVADFEYGEQVTGTNLVYLVKVADESSDWRGSDSTNETIWTDAGVLTRRFDETWATPKSEFVIGGCDLTPAGIVYTAHPTFVWSMPDESAWTKRFGSSYTAFTVRIKDKNTGNLVYDSGVVRAPKQDELGRFVWTAPVSVGDQNPQGKVFANNASYTWNVAMFNAKFQPYGNTRWSSGTSFTTSVNSQQPQNDAGFSSIGVTVKYTGPVDVLDGCENVTNSVTNKYDATIKPCQGIVRVQAFETADFSGVPASETYVADRVALTNANDVLKNCVLTGLAAGTYYIRAYIDMNGNFSKDDFESWGYAKTPVTVGSDVIRMPAVSLYIEDADTNGNWYPDAWEYAYINDWSKDWSSIAGNEAVDLRSNGSIILSSDVYEQMTNGLASVSTGLSGSKITVFQSTWFAKSILNPYVDPNALKNVTTTFDAIRKAVNSNNVERINQ